MPNNTGLELPLTALLDSIAFNQASLGGSLSTGYLLTDAISNQHFGGLSPLNVIQP